MKGLTLIIFCIGVLAIIGGLASMFGGDDGAMIVAGSVLIAGGIISASINTCMDIHKTQNKDQ